MKFKALHNGAVSGLPQELVGPSLHISFQFVSFRSVTLKVMPEEVQDDFGDIRNDFQ